MGDKKRNAALGCPGFIVQAQLYKVASNLHLFEIRLQPISCIVNGEDPNRYLRRFVTWLPRPYGRQISNATPHWGAPDLIIQA